MSRLARAMFSTLAVMTGGIACSAPSPPLPLTLVKDIPIGPATRRFDYASFDPVAGLLVFADLAGSRVLVFDTRSEALIKVLPGVASVHGVLAVSEIGRVYASATGSHELLELDERTWTVTARSPAGRYPDGVAWDPRERKLYVSDETGGAVAVIDEVSHRLLELIPMGGEVGNTQYDPQSGLIYSNAQGRGELVGIDPRTDRVVSRNRLPGCAGNHGLLIDGPRRLAFVACEDNARLVEFSLATHAQLAAFPVGGGPDVLAYDPAFRRLYVASESGVVTVFGAPEGRMTKLGEGYLADNAHTVAVNPTTHLVYFPLRNVGGKAVLRVMAPR